MKIFSNFSKGSDKLYYEILEDGFNIYISENTVSPFISQTEPFIPDHSKTYEENALHMCEELASPIYPVDDIPTLDDRLTNLESNVDYLMLLNDSTDE